MAIESRETRDNNHVRLILGAFLASNRLFVLAFNDTTTTITTTTTTTVTTTTTTDDDDHPVNNINDRKNQSPKIFSSKSRCNQL